jgi:hypothetical protein
MACKSVNVTVFYDLRGKPTGEFQFKCEGECTPGTDRCNVVCYTNPNTRRSEYYCKCVTPTPALKEFYTSDPPPGDDGLGELATVGEPDRVDSELVKHTVFLGGGATGFEFEPVCVGTCDEPKKCTVVTEDTFTTEFLPDGSLYRRKVKIHHCECLHKKRWL